MRPKQIAGQRVTPEAARNVLRLPRWGVGLARRLTQFTTPGVYEIRLVVMSDGRRVLDIAGRKEELRD